MTAFPPVIKNSIGENIDRVGVFGATVDPAKFLIEIRRFERPKLSIPGGGEFIWPLGIEGARIYGTASIAEHLYIGDNSAVMKVMHRDNRRIEMSGMFPGLTGASNMRDLLEIITAGGPDEGKVLTLPGLFPKDQLVMVESYEFGHPEDDRTQSWTYAITFRRQGVSGKVHRQPVINNPKNPTAKKKATKTGRVFTVRNNARTLRAIAKIVYKNIQRWDEIYNKNQKALNKLGVSLHQLPTKPLPLGMKLHY